ncbi:hypothetical protein [Comamonas kerstersii]|uniref:hypothetical protein n=1 Tax=Comamonas kerstersii TaxID=225992 RepID=UPI00267073E4|nr:hypothetical protein [Comamonas kerstersii]
MTDQTEPTLVSSYALEAGKETQIKTNVKTDYEVTVTDGTKIRFTVFPGQHFSITAGAHASGNITVAIVGSEFGRGEAGIHLASSND